MSDILPDPVEQAWLNLAIRILELAIEDVRQKRDSALSEEARLWLLSPMAKYIFEFFLPELDIDLEGWVAAGCPLLGKKWPKT
jgi:hypothetical protein